MDSPGGVISKYQKYSGPLLGLGFARLIGLIGLFFSVPREIISLFLCFALDQILNHAVCSLIPFVVEK